MGDRPPGGVGHYLRDLVYGSLDGAITTLAVVAGAAGAGLGARVAIVLGLANLGADGISMAASNYMGLKSELQQRGEPVAAEKPWRHGAATMAAFVVAGAVPLAAFLFPAGMRLAVAVGLTLVTLFFVGASRARFVPGPPARLGVEMAGVGAVAAAAAFAIGAGVERLL